MHFALLPAAGHSTRMGRPKLSLPLGDRTVIEHAIATIHPMIDKILVVVGPHVTELATFAKAAGAAVLQLSHETPDMRRTVEEGLNWIEVNWHPNDDDAFLLVPADHPVMDATVIKMLLARETRSAPETLRVAANHDLTLPPFRGEGRVGGCFDRDIVIPTFNGQRGHPTSIGWRHVIGIRALPAHLGLNSYFRQQPDATREVAIDSESILFDMDTPEDYERMKRLIS